MTGELVGASSEPASPRPGGPSGPTDEDLKQALLALLPEDGAARSNPFLQKQLNVDKATYWRVRDLLVEEGSASRGRGRGGSTSRVLEDPAVDPPPVTEAPSAERPSRSPEGDLYAPLRAVLLADWQKDKGFEYLAVEDVARAGSRPTGGKWTRPDLVAVEVQILTYLPSKVLNVHTFEVKPADAIDVTAVYEALAHRRAATHSWVLLHVPGDAETATLEVVIAEARRHGIGVVVFADPTDYETWEERVVADRFDPSPSALNEFIKIQLPEAVRTKIEKAVR